MERAANEKATQFVNQFKQQLSDKCATLMGNTNAAALQELTDFINGYEPLCFTKEDLNKKKRPKNFVPIYDRCRAKRSSEEQCTRRKKEGCEYCGTHTKGTPHGVISDEPGAAQQSLPPGTQQKVDVWAQDIMGIVYYVDRYGNVYETEDVLSNRLNPKIIAKYEIRNEQYVIPDFC